MRLLLAFLIPVLGECTFEEAVRFYDEDKLDKAIECFSQIIHNDPTHAQAYWYRGAAYILNGQSNLALVDLNRSSELDSNSSMPFYWRANYYLRKQNYLRAVEEYSKALTKNDATWKNYLGRARAYLLLSRQAEADADLMEQVKMREDSLTAYFAVANTYESFGYHDEALRIHFICLQKDSTLYNTYGNIGWVYYLKGDFDKCIEYSLIATRMNPQAYYADYNRALCYLRLGDLPKAYSLYAEAFAKAGKSNATDGAIEDLRALVRNDIVAKNAKIVLTDILNTK